MMRGKPMSWTFAALMFVWLCIFTFGIDMAINPVLRHQAFSMNPDFWLRAFPAALASNALVVLAARFIYNWRIAKPSHANLEANRSA
jgi:hypothetical protein